jgi:hypothetical protein
MLKFLVSKPKLNCYLTFRKMRSASQVSQVACFDQYINEVPSALTLTKPLSVYKTNLLFCPNSLKHLFVLWNKVLAYPTITNKVKIFKLRARYSSTCL